METKKKNIPGSKLCLPVCAGIFLWMFACNLLTPYLVDDFNYMYSFATGERIRSIWEIFPSMAVHAREINGRLVAHWFAQFTLMFPVWVFDIANALIFAVQVLMIERMGRAKEEKSSGWMLLTTFAGLWLFQLGFGNINLWQDGSVNYLWSFFFGLLYLWPFAKRFLNGDSGLRRGVMPVYLVLSLLAGAYIEGTSVAMIVITGCLGLLQWYMEKKRPENWQFAALGLAVLGQISIYLAPAQWLKKASGSGASLLYNILRSFGKYWDLRALIFLLMALIVIAWISNVDRKRILFAVCLFVGTMASNFMMAFAVSYPERAVGNIVVLLVMADVLLLQELMKTEQWKSFAICILMIAALALPKHLAVGAWDIYNTYIQDKANVEHILESKDAGEQVVAIRYISINTQYSGASQIRYIASDPTIWPNNSMAKYYEVDAIVSD